MIDPEKDGAPDYLDFVKEPMALAEVKRKLSKNAYQTVDQYKRDVNLIWNNAATYNGEGTLFTFMAREAQHWFNKKMKKFPSCAAEEWTRKIQKTTKRFYKVLAHPPPELDQNGQLAIHTNSDDDDIKPEDLIPPEQNISKLSEEEEEEKKEDQQDENKKDDAESNSNVSGEVSQQQSVGENGNDNNISNPVTSSAQEKSSEL